MSMPDRPGQEAQKLPAIDPVAPYQRLAVALREQVLAGAFVPGLPLPSMKRLADEHGVAISTARKAVNLLGEWGLVDISQGRSTVVRKLQGREVPEIAYDAPSSASKIDPGDSAQEWLDLEIRRLGRTVARLAAQATPSDGNELRQLLTDAVKRDGQPASAIGGYEMVVRRAGESEPLRTFVTTTSG